MIKNPDPIKKDTEIHNEINGGEDENPNMLGKSLIDENIQNLVKTLDATPNANVNPESTSINPVNHDNTSNTENEMDVAANTYDNPENTYVNPENAYINPENTYVNPENTLNVANELNEAASSNPDVSENVLRTAAEMFTYLNYKPSKLIVFYKSLFKTALPREILWALTSIVKVSQNAAKESSKKILQNTLKALKLTQFENIEHFARGTGVLNYQAVSKILGRFVFKSSMGHIKKFIKDPKSFTD